jgi:aspartyl-tRNA(Asn)/glutamyl-tRNA(Gln) amidotransferase subunit A
MLADLERPDAWTVAQQIREGRLRAEEHIGRILERVSRVEGEVRAYITLTEEQALAQARQLDRQLGRGEDPGPLAGLAVAVKDNICTRGILTTCASRILEGFTPPYSATVVELVEGAGGIIVGKANMDEFAMGSSTEFSAFGPTHNPYDLGRVPGGSSGGSAAAVAAGEADLALGSDTGGSIRCPAAFCGVVGLKPTYGLVSRYGLIAYANSLEQIGPLTRSVRDLALLLSVIARPDPRDATSLSAGVDYTRFLRADVKGLKIGVPRELFGEGTEPQVVRAVWRAIELLGELGASWEEVELPSLRYALPAYYIVAVSEASSNLARYDGVRYGLALEVEGDWEAYYSRVRARGFGAEVKRRIILGTFALSAGYYDQYYLKAQRVRTLIRRDFAQAFKRFDLLASPAMPTRPFRLGERARDPLAMYMADVDTVPANLAGIPALSVPCQPPGELPIGLQLMAPPFREDLLIRAAYTYEVSRGW